MPFIADVHDPALFRPLDSHNILPSPKKTDAMYDHVQKMTCSLAVEPVTGKGNISYFENVTPSDSEMSSVEMEGLEYNSRPPSPPLSGTSTPRLHIGPCPIRLAPTIPPSNYGVITRGMVFRSAFPQDRNLEFLKGLQVKTILCLVDTQPGAAYDMWVHDHSIQRRRVDIAANKEGKIKTTWDSLCEALLIMMDATNYPLYIHCNQGRHRTGCVVACLRKVQRWPMEDIIAEYETYSNPKMRTADKDLVQSFDPEAVFTYSRKHGRFDDRPFMRRMDSVIVDIDSLARALSFDDCNVDVLAMDVTTISNASYVGDHGGLEMMASTENDIPGHGAVVALNAEMSGCSSDQVVDDKPENEMVIDGNVKDVEWTGDTLTTVEELREDD